MFLVRHYPQMVLRLCRTPARLLQPVTLRQRSVMTRFKEEQKPEQAQSVTSDASKSGLQQQQQQPLATRSPADVAVPRTLRRFNDTLAQVQREMDTMMNQFFGDDMLSPIAMDRSFGLLGNPMRTGAALNALVPVEVEETDKEYLITADVPGFSKDEIKATLSHDGILTLSGERKEEEESKGRRSTRFSTFNRSFRMPSDANSEGIAAKVKDGVMYVTVPKHLEEQKPHKEIPIL